MAKTTQADPFDFWRLYGQEKYSLQNMEVKSFKFPYEVEERHIHCVYDDRLPHGIWQDATRLIETGATGDAFFNGATASTQDAYYLFQSSQRLTICHYCNTTFRQWAEGKEPKR